jgi:hypothetical protein
MFKFFAFSVGLALTSPAFASCDVRLKHPVQSCPAVAYGPEDCEETLRGTAGDVVPSPAVIHIMTSGHSYYCPSHEGCIEMKDLSFKGCIFTPFAREPGESKEYSSHIAVGDKAWTLKLQRFQTK